MVNKIYISLLSFFPSKTKGSPEPKKAIQEVGITEDGDENEDDEGRTIYPYERLTTTAEDPVASIDVTQREVSDWIAASHLTRVPTTGYRYQVSMTRTVTVRMQVYLSSAEFREKFGMSRAAFNKLPKWKQSKLKSGLNLF
jgi:gelsolin